MNLNRLAILPTGLFALIVAADQLLAQSAALDPDKPSNADADKIITLSPFVVDSSRDTGYQATSTLAGTRLNTPLKDLGSSISVYTKDFLDDIGATSATDLMIYATGMEAAGAAGNYSGAITDINATEVIGNSNPQVARTRGLASPNFTRGFFNTNIAVDAYNTDAVTVQRGPNAMLFGAGSPAGVVDQALLLPNLQRNTNKTVTRYGNNDSWRQSVDFNHVLVPRKLAVRIAALYDDNEYEQRPAFEIKERIYGAMTYAPFKSTEIRVNFESGGTRAKRPMTTLPVNSISDGWYAAGRQGYDWKFYDDPALNPAAKTIAASATTEGILIGSTSIYSNLIYVYNNPTDTAMASAFESSLTNGNGANSIQTNLFQPQVNRDQAADTIRFNVTRATINLPATYWVGANVLPGQQPGFVPVGIRRQGFTDLSAFDFNHQMLDTSPQQSDSFHTFNVALEQRAWGDRVGIELAYNAERYDSRSENNFFSNTQGNAVYIDTNVTLPTGQPNPNVGRPFAVARDEWPMSFNDRKNVRVNFYLRYDFKDLGAQWGKWLGHHTFTGLYENDATENIRYSTRPVTDGNAARAINATINVEARSPRMIAYMGPSLIGNNNPLQLQQINVPMLQLGPVGVPVQYFFRQANLTDPGAFVNDTSETFLAMNNGGSASREVIKSQSAGLQSYWLQDNLITLVGWHRDQDYFASKAWQIFTDPNDLNAIGKVQYGFNDFSFPSTPPPNAVEEIMSYSAVLRWPQRLIKLPAGIDFSVFYNQSQNFTPTGGRVDAYNDPLPSPQGHTKEYGFNFSAFNDKLSLRVNWFETSVQGQSLSTPLYSTATNAAIFGTAILWAQEGNINPQLAATRNDQIALLFSPLPANYAQLYGYNVTGTAPNISGTRGNLSGITDTTDYTAKGTEFELTYNPTRNWRILVNVAKQQTVQSNTLPFLKKFIALMKPVWDQLANVSYQNYPLNWQPGQPIPGQTYGQYIETNVYVPFATALATEGTASAEQRKWRANLVTNYSFGHGAIFGEALKGWGIGCGVRWQDKLGIGYPTSRDPDGTAHIDIAHPYYAPPDTNVDAWVSYQRKIWHNRIDWKLQLNASNILGGDDPIAITVQPWGQIANARIAPEKRWYLTSSFGF